MLYEVNSLFRIIRQLKKLFCTLKRLQTHNYAFLLIFEFFKKFLKIFHAIYRVGHF